MSGQHYRIVGHSLCPYVQRVVIVMLERNIAFDRTDIDLDNKPAWLKEISPNGQVPVLRVGDDGWLFESSVIAQYLDQVSGNHLLPRDPLDLARQNAWMSFADGMLNIVARIIYREDDAEGARDAMTDLVRRLEIVDARLPRGNYLAGPEFGLLDAVFATLFRYFPVLDRVTDVKIQAKLAGGLRNWWELVSVRPSIATAVPGDYEEQLVRFIGAKNSHAGRFVSQH